MTGKQGEFGWPEIDEAWRAVTMAFAHYGKEIRPLRGTRRDHLSRLIADGYSAADLVSAVHGYVHWHGGLAKKPDGFEPLKWFTPDTVFRLDKLETRIEFGSAGPFRTRRDVAKERAQAAEGERRREIDKVKEERRLRAV